jgi:hypothetical protein
LEKLARVKHSSLLQTLVNYGRKSFITLTLGQIFDIGKLPSIKVDKEYSKINVRSLFFSKTYSFSKIGFFFKDGADCRAI